MELKVKVGDFDNYFIVGIDITEGMVTYHYGLNNLNYFKVHESKITKKWDGHTSDDVSRLLSIWECLV